MPKKSRVSDGFVATTFLEAAIQPDSVMDMIAYPQVNLVGPYYLGIRTDYGQDVYIERLQFANVTPIVGRHEPSIPHVFFEMEMNKDWPQGLVPIEGPRLCIANTIYLKIRNRVQMTQKVSAIVWAKQDMEPLVFNTKDTCEHGWSRDWKDESGTPMCPLCPK